MWVGIVGASLLCACGPARGGIGQTCDDSSGCETDLQCLRGTCAPLCQGHAACGDGYTCTTDGECLEVHSSVGQACSRERDCGPGQACHLDADDGSVLTSTCQADQLGGVTGGTCSFDDDCRNHLCALGRCTELCITDDDCPNAMTCASMPRLLPDAAPQFKGCLQSGDTLAFEIPVRAPYQKIRVPVPSNALSFAMVSRVDDEDDQLVGAARVVSPSGALLYATPFQPADFYLNPLRHQPARTISTLLVPNTPAINLEVGVYSIEVASFLETGGNGTAIPDVTVVYKLGEGMTLDLDLRFLDLEEHPCGEAFQYGLLNANAALTSDPFQTEYLGELRTIFHRTGIELGNITYVDLDRHEFDGVAIGSLPGLLALSEHDAGVTVFFVRSIEPAGIQAIAGGAPGPPRIAGSAASGVVVSVDTLCYREWSDLARATAHELGRYLGLFRNREPEGPSDPIPDSDTETTNLMFYGEFGGSVLSDGQAHVLSLNPALR